MARATVSKRTAAKKGVQAQRESSSSSENESEQQPQGEESRHLEEEEEEVDEPLANSTRASMQIQPSTSTRQKAMKSTAQAKKTPGIQKKKAAASKRVDTPPPPPFQGRELESESSENDEPPPQKTQKTKPRSMAKKAGLTFPVLKIHKQFKQADYVDKIFKTASVYMTSTIEYLVAEIIELAGRAAHDNRRQRITPRHIQLAIRNDEELDKLLANVTIASGGVLPHIESVLLPKTNATKGNAPKKVGESSKPTKVAAKKRKNDDESEPGPSKTRKNTKSAPAPTASNYSDDDSD